MCPCCKTDTGEDGGGGGGVAQWWKKAALSGVLRVPVCTGDDPGAAIRACQSSCLLSKPACLQGMCACITSCICFQRTAPMHLPRPTLSTRPCRAAAAACPAPAVCVIQGPPGSLPHAHCGQVPRHGHHGDGQERERAGAGEGAGDRGLMEGCVCLGQVRAGEGEG